MRDAVIPSGSRRIPSAPNYLATPGGQIFSTVTGRILGGGMGTNGRAIVVVVAEGKKRTRGVHVLVCEAWHGRRPTGKVVSHLDGDKLNNSPINLAWETQKENLAHKREHGTRDDGFNNSRASLTPETVDELYRLRKDEQLTHQAIAERLGVSRTTVSRVLNGLRYQTDAAYA